MGRRLDRLSLENLGDLPQDVQTCVFWELDQVSRSRARGHESAEKRAWLAEVLDVWGPCGRVLYLDEEYAGHVVWAPPAHLPGAANFATAPASADCVVVASAHVLPSLRGQGLGRLLAQSMIKDVVNRADGRDVRAIEAFAAERPRPADCVLPVDFWLALGFVTQRPHPAYPRMRLDLRRLATWRDELGQARERLERLTGGIRNPAGQPALRDAGQRESETQPMKSASSLRITDLGRAPVISLTTWPSL